MANNDDFKMKTSEWRGYTLKALEDLDKNDIRIEGKIEKLNIKIDVLQKQIMNNRVKLASISATVAFIVALITNFIVNVA